MGLWDIEPQIVFLMVSLIIGLVTGLLFDIYRRIRNLFSPGPYLTALGDLCFWSLITVITFTSLLTISSGQVRGYVFIGIAAGLSLYLHFISPYVIAFFVALNIHVISFSRKVSFFISKVRKIKAFQLTRRIWTDAKRIFSKRKHK